MSSVIGVYRLFVNLVPITLVPQRKGGITCRVETTKGKGFRVVTLETVRDYVTSNVSRYRGPL